MKDYLLKSGSGYRFDDSGNLLCVEGNNFVRYNGEMLKSVLLRGGSYFLLCDGKKLSVQGEKWLIQ